jgi:hypothetical protein
MRNEHVEIPSNSRRQIRRERRYGEKLTEVESRVVRWLAEHGPKTGYDLFRKDRIISSSTWVDIKERTDLIVPLDLIKSNAFHYLDDANTDESYEAAEKAFESKYQKLKGQRGARKQEPYWLMEGGIVEAINMGVDPKRILAVMVENSIESEELRLVIEIALAGGPRWSRENLNRDSVESILEGSLSIEAPYHPLGEVAFVSAIRSHPVIAKRIGNHYAERAKLYSETAKLLLSDDAWKGWVDDKNKEAKDPVVNLMAVLREEGGVSHAEAVQILIKCGMKKEEAASMIGYMDKQGYIDRTPSGWRVGLVPLGANE